MANRAYVSFWSRDYSEDLMLDRFERLLETVPLSATRPGFTRFVVRAISSAETPIIEHDLRGVTVSAPDIIALAREHRNADAAYEVEGYWDLWQRSAEDGNWQRGPEPLLFTCHGEEYDDGVAKDFGHFLAAWASSISIPGMAACWERTAREAPQPILSRRNFWPG